VQFTVSNEGFDIRVQGLGLRAGPRVWILKILLGSRVHDLL